MKYFQEVARFFKKTYPIYVRRTKLASNLDGICEKRYNKFIICINRDLPENHAVDVLLHEIAHVNSWGKEPNEHGPLWGKCYAKVYRMFLKEFTEC